MDIQTQSCCICSTLCENGKISKMTDLWIHEYNTYGIECVILHYM